MWHHPGTASLRWPLAMQFATKEGKNHKLVLTRAQDCQVQNFRSARKRQMRRGRKM